MKTIEVLGVIARLRKLDPEISAVEVSILMICAREDTRGQLTMSDLAKELGLNLATTSRHCANLSEINRYKEQGLNLIKMKENIMDRRQKFVSLTDQGRVLLRAMNIEF